MLGKVMKHEMKATWKVLFPLAMGFGRRYVNWHADDENAGFRNRYRSLGRAGNASLVYHWADCIERYGIYFSAGSVLPQHVWCRRLFVTYPSGNHLFLD